MTLKAITMAALFVAASASREEIVPTVPRTFDHQFGRRLAGASSAEDMLASLGCDYEITNDFVSKHNGVRHVYFQQMVHGIPVQNGVGSMNVKPNGEVVSFSSSFFPNPESVPLKKSAFKPESAVENLMSFVDAKASDCATAVDPVLRYVQTESGELELAYRIECDLGINWLESYVSTETGKVIVQLDYVDGSGTYDVYGIPDVDPGYGPNIVVSKPHLESYPAAATTLGWHDQGNGKTFTTTVGNNVYAQENLDGSSSWQNNYRPDGGESLNFNVSYDLTLSPEVQPNLDNSIANLFYWNNLIHDITYGFGFDEASGNFQENNLGRGGLQNDAVQANAQDGAGYNNANFATPADGSRPRMRMYVWNGFSPFRDGDLDAGIVYHEYGHGISNRLTGGASRTGCLSGVANGAGMGEGWSDFFGKIVVLREGDTRDMIYPMGGYVTSDGAGIRTYPYSSDMEANPLTFGNMNESPYATSVHAAGTVWCTALWEVMWNLIEVYGWDANQFSNGTGGNTVAMQLVVDGLKLQPCLPSMLDARDAILLADELTYNGANQCYIWEGFAKRGFGVGASISSFRYTEDFSVPSACEKTQ